MRVASTPFITALSRYIRANQLIAPGQCVLVAVSGGPDSLVLLDALVALRSILNCTLHVVHLDHMLRGEASAAEARFVAEQARIRAIPATIATIDVAQVAARSGENLYAAGRRARYKLFAETAHQVGAHAVAVAHTADDQAETVLMHLLRGAGADGLAGMRALVTWDTWQHYGGAQEATIADRYGSPNLIRPLLGTTRAAIEQYCHACELTPQHDPSNADTRHTRSKIRHELIPQLIEYNPHIIEALCRTAETLAVEHDLSLQSLDAIWPQLAQRDSARIILNLAVWGELHPALQRLALRRVYTSLGGAATLTHADIERVCSSAERGAGRQIELPGKIVVWVGYRSLTIGQPIGGQPQIAISPTVLIVPGTTLLQDGWRIVAEPNWVGNVAASRWEALFDPAVLEAPLIIRGRQPGDRIIGRHGSRSIQDLMVDAKIPRELRANWPLLVVGEQIIWVMGIRIAEQARASTERALRVCVIEPEQVAIEE